MVVAPMGSVKSSGGTVAGVLAANGAADNVGDGIFNGASATCTGTCKINGVVDRRVPGTVDGVARAGRSRRCSETAVAIGADDTSAWAEGACICSVDVGAGGLGADWEFSLVVAADVQRATASGVGSGPPGTAVDGAVG